MDAVLLDTDVFSFLIKAGDSRAELYRAHVKGKTIALSFVTVGELFAWSVKKKWGAVKTQELEQRIKAAVVVPYDLDLCRQFGRLKAELMMIGRSVPANDLWIDVCSLLNLRAAPKVGEVRKNLWTFHKFPPITNCTNSRPTPYRGGTSCASTGLWLSQLHWSLWHSRLAL
jgi:predicted nucleic acid-binding protein